jgi:lysophospholipid acyltransferase
MLLTLLDEQFEKVAEIFELPTRHIVLISCLFVSIPIGFIFQRIKDAHVRNICSFVLGFFLQYWVYREHVLFPLISALFTYYFLKFFGREKAVLHFVVSMIYLSFFHVYKLMTDWSGWEVEISVILMINIPKYTAFTWSYQDGGKKEEDLSPEQFRNRIVKLPSLLDYLSYIYFYGSAIVGPSYDYKVHEEFINRQGDYARDYHTLLPTLAYVGSGFINMMVVVLFEKTYNAFGTLTPEFAKRDFLGKCVYMVLSAQVMKSLYFTPWLVSTASVTAAGLNYNLQGKTFFERYGKVISVRPINHEIADNIKDKIDEWNIPVQQWLKNYVYFRIVTQEEARKNPKKAALASNITFMVSALWHGFYPLYYLVFFWFFLTQQVSKSLYNIRHRFGWIPKPIGFIIRWLITTFIGGFASTTFVLLDFRKGVTFFRAWHYMPWIIAGSLFLIFNFTNVAKEPRAKNANGIKKQKV